MRPSSRWAAAAVALGVTIVACSGGSDAPKVASVSSSSTSTTAPVAGGSPSTEQTPLAQAQAYSRCMRSNGVPKFPDPELTPGGDYGYRTVGIDGNSAAFQGALDACKDLPSPWNATGEQLSPAEQEAWLRWADCIRAHGMPDLPDPTFEGNSVRLASREDSNSPQFRQAVDACKSQMPSTGGLGG